MNVNNDYTFIGSDLRMIRESKGITRKEMSKEMYISEETIRRIEKGENDPRLSTLVPICNYLDIDINDVVDDKKFEYNKFISLRDEINYLLNNSSVEKANYLINSLDDINFNFNLCHKRELLATRYYFMGLLGIIKDDHVNNPSNYLEEALSCMNYRFKINNFKNYSYDDFSLRILLALASNEYKKGNFDLYKDIMLEIKKYLNSSLDNYFVFSYNLATYYYRIGNYLDSIKVCNDAIANARNVKKTLYLNMVYYIKGVNHFYLNQFKKAKESFNYCLMLTNIFSTKALSDSISKQINNLDMNNK